MQHTFEQGDCVIGPHGKGVFVKYGYDSSSVHVQYRMGNECVRFLHTIEAVSHDTDLRKGDWVRYEATENRQGSSPQRNGEIAQIVRVYEDQSGFEVTDGDMPSYVARANAVKIQPPQEGAMGTKPEVNPDAEKFRDDAIERGIKEKIQLLERQVEKAKCYLETYRDLKKFIAQGKGE